MHKGQNTLALGKLSAAVALAAAAFSISAQAAEDYKTVEAVSVTAEALKIDASTEETPQTVNVINQEELENKIYRKVDDALRYTPGFVNPYGADYDTNWMRMRGFEVTTLVDGQVQYKEGFFDTTIEPFGLEAIEVISGPSSALYGDSQPGGVVNLVTKKPTKTPQHSVTVTAGTQKFVQGGLDISDFASEDGSKRYRLVAMANREDSFVDDVDGWRAYIAPSFTIDISEKTSLTLLASYLKDKKTPSAAFMPTWGTVIPRNGQWVSYGTNYGDPEHDTYDKDQATFGWEFKHAVNDHVEYKQSFTAKYTDLYFRTTAAYGSFDEYGHAGIGPAPGVGLYRSTVLNDGTETSFTFDNNLTGSWYVNDFDSIVQVGFDYQHHKNSWRGNGLGSTPTLLSVDPFHPSYEGLPSDEEIPVWNNEIKKQQLGLYTQAQTTWNETILLKGGLRYDFVKVDAVNEDPSSVNDSDSMDEGQLSWNAGVMYYGPFGISPYVNYSEAFFTNASMTAITNAVTEKTGYYLYEPIETKQIEAGIKFTPEWLDGYVNVAWFHLKQKNALAQAVLEGALMQSQVNLDIS